MPMATMTSKGQITVPKAVRDALGLIEGTKVDFELLPDGAALMRVKRKSIMSLFGKYSTGGIKVSIDEMDPRTLDIFK
ncbi:MAG TPA: AbrB/MazE/SpoVT family DNA-binding domain-containing protein [Gemmatimonadaceae bacterium]